MILQLNCKSFWTISFYVSAFLEETGVCKVEEYKLLDSQVLFKVRDSIFVQDIENKKPVCMPLSGALAGVFEEITGKEMQGA
jgi:predicted hydrocarbon binding protein